MKPSHSKPSDVDAWGTELVDHERWLAEVAMHTHNGVVITDAQGLTIWVNPAFERLSGYELSSLLGKKPGELLQGPDTDPATIRLIRDRLKARQPISGLEILNYTPAGDPYWVALDITPVSAADGQLSHFVAIETPLNIARATQAELLALQQRYRLAVQSSGIGIWEFVPGAAGPSMDERALTCLLGLPPVESTPSPLTPLAWSDLPRSLSRWRSEMLRVQGSDARFEIEVLIDSTDDEPRAIQIIGQGSLDADGRVLGVVLDRTSALRERLQQDAAELEAMLKVERRDAFGRLRRDLRMPMNSMLGFVQLLRHDLSALGLSALVERVDRVESAGEQLLQMLDEVLASGQSEAERETQLQPVQLREALLRLLPREVAADLRLLETESVFVWVDPVLLRRALSIVTDVRSSLGSMAATTRLIVGLGADRGRVELQFEVETGSPAPSTDQSLRLQLLRRLVESMGGQLRVSSWARGHRLQMELRRSLGVTQQRNTASDARRDVWQRRSDVMGRLLYVEDDLGNVELVRHALIARPGVELLVANDAPSALKLLADSAVPDMVLLDLVLPGVSGLSLLKTLRSDARYRELPCVVLTAIDDSQQEQEARTLGANDYLTKPLRLNQLLSRIDRFLGEVGEDETTNKPGAM